MNDQDFENYISQLAAGLPRRGFNAPDKSAVWSRIQNYLRSQRLDPGVWRLWRFSRAVAGILIVVLSLGVVGGVARAAKGSLPGESLYPVKKVVEKVEVVIAAAQGQEKKVATLKSHAKTRLLEVATLVEEKKAEAPVVQETLAALAETTAAVAAVSGAHVEELAKEEQAVLVSVADKAEGAVKEEVQKALAALPSGSEVQGVASDADKPAATSTPVTGSAARKIQPQDRILRSPIIIDDIDTGTGSGAGINNQPPLPDESGFGF